MASLNKLTLNNQIVSMRHDVRRAKLYVINKNVREARKLKKRYGTGEQKSKYDRKSDRLIEEIELIKKIRDDEVSKFFLTNKKKPLEILRSPESELKTKVLAKICMNNFLNAFLLELEKNYPNWRDEVPLLLPQLSRKTKNKNKTQHLKENSFIKTTATISSKIKPDTKSHVVNTPGNNGFLVVDTKKRQCTEEPQDDKQKMPKHNKCKKFKDGPDVNSSKPDVEEIDKINHDGLKNFKSGKKVLENYKAIENEEKIRTQKKETKVVDPFFVTADNTEYMTVATSEKQIEALKNTDQHLRNKAENLSSSGFHSHKYGSNENFTSFKKFGRPNASERNNHGKKFNNKSNFKEKPDFNKRKFVKSEENLPHNGLARNGNHEEKLHPSWEAKKRQSGFSQFSGRKIVFSDD